MVSIFINIIVIFNILFWSVVEPTLLKNMTSSVGMIIPNWMEKTKLFQTTNQYCLTSPSAVISFFKRYSANIDSWVISNVNANVDIPIIFPDIWHPPIDLHHFSSYSISIGWFSGNISRTPYHENIGFSMDFQNSRSIYSADLSISGRIQGWSDRADEMFLAKNLIVTLQ